MKRLLTSLALAAVTATSAAAAPPVSLVRQSEGWTYFNRPGATLAEQQRELPACQAVITGFPPNSVVQGGVVTAVLDGMRADSMAAANLENCMVVRGWRVVRIPDSQGRDLSEQKPSAIRQWLTDQVGADAPDGQIVRTWNNDAGRRETIASAMPGMGARPSLSVLALPRASKGAPAVRPPLYPSRQKDLILRAKTPPRRADVPPGYGVLLVGMSNSGAKTARFQMVRQGPSFDLPAARADDKPDTMIVGNPPARGETRVVAMVIPAGRWILFGTSDVTSLCLGAPYIDIAPGEVAYTGMVDVGNYRTPIDPQPDPGRQYLAGSDLAPSIKPAAWGNGETFRCLFGFMTALELQGVPFKEGYVRAGQPLPQPAAP